MKSLLEARWWGPCTLGLNTLSSLPSHTSNHCSHFHTQHEGTKGGSMEVSPSLWVERDTGHFALSSLRTWLVYSSASHTPMTVQTNHLRVLLNVASDLVGLEPVPRLCISNQLPKDAAAGL